MLVSGRVLVGKRHVLLVQKAKGIFLRVRSVSFRDGTWLFPKIGHPKMDGL